MSIEVEQAGASFTRWGELLQLLHAAYADHSGRIDPPSSLHALDAASLARKAAEECLFIAHDGDELVGCAFVRSQPGSLYIGKVAVAPHRQRRGIARLLMQAIERYALHGRCFVLELETRVELTENHATFGALGFVKVSEHAHAGYCRTTFIRMQKLLQPAAR